MGPIYAPAVDNLPKTVDNLPFPVDKVWKKFPKTRPILGIMQAHAVEKEAG
jgi:hypothetical protein